jgi:hypothetical protein
MIVTALDSVVASFPQSVIVPNTSDDRKLKRFRKT